MGRCSVKSVDWLGLKRRDTGELKCPQRCHWTLMGTSSQMHVLLVEDEVASHCHAQTCKFGRPRFLYSCFMRPIVKICEFFASAHLYTSRKRFCSFSRNRHLRRRVRLSIPKFHFFPSSFLKELGVHGVLAWLSRTCCPFLHAKLRRTKGKTSVLSPSFVLSSINQQVIHGLRLT